MFNKKLKERIKKLENLVMGEEQYDTTKRFETFGSIPFKLTVINTQIQNLDARNKQLEADNKKLKALLNEVIDHVYKENE